MQDQSGSDHDRIEILGQIFSYPRTAWGTLSVAIVVIGICFVVWVAAKNSQAVKDISGILIGRATAVDAPADARYLIQFWTPSMKTKEADDVADWEKMDNDSKLDDFGKTLVQDAHGRIGGYRRYEVIGFGLSHRRAGIWWVVTATNDYKVTDLVKSYHKFWKNDASIYVEVLRSGAAGSYQK